MENNVVTRKAKVSKFGKNVIIAGIIAVVIISSYSFLKDVFTHPEKYSTQDRYQFEMKLERGDEAAIADYKKYYIEDNIYLYNNDLTLRLLAEQYGIKYSVVRKAYDAMDTDSIQEFHDDYIQDDNILKLLKAM